MKTLTAIFLVSFSTLSFAEDSNEFFNDTLEEASSLQSLKDLAAREEQITRAAKAVHARRELGIDYNDSTGWVQTQTKKTSLKTDETQVFRMPASTTINDDLPIVSSVVGDKVELLHQGSSATYSEGDRVGRYFVQLINISKVVLRDTNGKQHELSTDW